MQALAIGVGFPGFLARGRQVLDARAAVTRAAVNVVVLDRVGDAAARRDVRDQRLGARVRDMPGEKIILEPGLTGVGSTVDHETTSVVQDVVHGLKPEIGQIAGLYLMQSHKPSCRERLEVVRRRCISQAGTGHQDCGGSKRYPSARISASTRVARRPRR